MPKLHLYEKLMQLFVVILLYVDKLVVSIQMIVSDFMGAGVSQFATPGRFFFGPNEDDLIESFEILKGRLRYAEKGMSQFQQEKDHIVRDISQLKNMVSPTEKFWDMVMILDKEWNSLKLQAERVSSSNDFVGF